MDENKEVHESSFASYNVIRNRLTEKANELKDKLEKLNKERLAVFGEPENRLFKSEVMLTENSCIPRDIVSVGKLVILGYNVNFGLKTVEDLSDIFSFYEYDESGLKKASSKLFEDETFKADFKDLFKYYKESFFAKFYKKDGIMHMIFQVGKDYDSLKSFKWNIKNEDKPEYIGNRFVSEVKLPEQQEFKWIETVREEHIYGMHPHISIYNKIFVETVGGDLTIKIENNTNSGKGIYTEEVEDKNQKLDDASIFYTSVGNLILLKIRPYQEKEYRYIVFNEKTKEVKRVDSIGKTAILLPENHGLIFPDGIFLQSGEYKKFDIKAEDILFQNRKASLNGEDYQYIFYNRTSGEYYIYTYNIINQSIATPLICNGYTRFKNGEMIVFKQDSETKKNHTVQIWKTSFKLEEEKKDIKSDEFLYTIGNKEIVTLMAECNSLNNIIRKDDSYYGLYVDISNDADNIANNYFWIDKEEAFNIKDTLLEIKTIGTTAIKEFEKVNQVKSATENSLKKTTEDIEKLLKTILYHTFETVNDYVFYLAEIRKARNECANLREMQFIKTVEVDNIDNRLKESNLKLSEECVNYLLRDDALKPYSLQVEEIEKLFPTIKKAIDGKELNERIVKTSEELELLISIISNLKIEDTTKSAEIIDKISILFSKLNQCKSKLKSIVENLDSKELELEFFSKMNLIGNSVSNYIDISDTAEKVQNYLTKIVVQLDELESKFSDFKDFIVTITDKREEIISAFESKKQNIIQAKSKKTDTLVTAVERIFKGLENRLKNAKDEAEINEIFSTDLMVEKIRENVEKLTELGEGSKGSEISKKLKTLKENSVKELKDKKELYIDENTIKLGSRSFTVNSQNIELSFMRREDSFYIHISGTDFWEKMENSKFAEFEEVWNQDIISENSSVYRGEYLAYKVFEIIGRDTGKNIYVENEQRLKELLTEYMESNYIDYYTKGVSDVDGLKILKEILKSCSELELASYSPIIRAVATIFWNFGVESELKDKIKNRLKSVNRVSKYSSQNIVRGFVEELAEKAKVYFEDKSWFEGVKFIESAEYLAKEISKYENFVISKEAYTLYEEFITYLTSENGNSDYKESLEMVSDDIEGKYIVISEWVESFFEKKSISKNEFFYELISILISDDFKNRRVVARDGKIELNGIAGVHQNIINGVYKIELTQFFKKMEDFSLNKAPLFKKFQELKSEVLKDAKKRYRFEELTPKVLPSFVRNRLIDRVYLPLIGDNLAKQIGEAGRKQRTDNMGMLLLISPPGYGKTTLIEYISSRLNMILVKVNCPTLGHNITSLDPEQADNINAKEELKKLNFAFEMGNNVMIYLDDIQHSNPEFLQKFISLCDGQRKIEGIYEGKSKTYDFRGKRVAVVMAGNPYTESGEKFKIPDMLSNRSDVYNLGDMLHENEEAFKMSYIENAITSNIYVNNIYGKSQSDFYKVVESVERGEDYDIELAGNYSDSEVDEAVKVIKNLIRVRKEILTVNKEYIYSASQNSDYRVEPSFKLQGSYRNMNKIAEKIVPVMNEDERKKIVENSYMNDAQTLAGDAEASLLKFREITERIDEKQAERWQEIKNMFLKNKEGKDNDKLLQVIKELGRIADSIGVMKQ
jgi:hypothetical protein